jgi:hypothetical protein
VFKIESKVGFDIAQLIFVGDGSAISQVGQPIWNETKFAGYSGKYHYTSAHN